MRSFACMYTLKSSCLPARMLWAGGRTCGRCRWWQRCRRWWYPKSPSTTAVAAQGLSFSPVTSLHLYSVEHSLPSHHAGYDNEGCMESSIHYLHLETEKRVMSSNSLKPHVHKQSNQVSKWPEGQLFLPYGYCSIDRAPLLYSSWENLSLFRHLSNSSEPTRTGVREGESRRKGAGVIDNITPALVHTSVCIWCNILTDEGFPFDYRWWHHVSVTAPAV